MTVFSAAALFLLQPLYSRVHFIRYSARSIIQNIKIVVPLVLCNPLFTRNTVSFSGSPSLYSIWKFLRFRIYDLQMGSPWFVPTVTGHCIGGCQGRRRHASVCSLIFIFNFPLESLKNFNPQHSCFDTKNQLQECICSFNHLLHAAMSKKFLAPSPRCLSSLIIFY